MHYYGTPGKLPNDLTVFTSLYDSGGQKGVDVLSVDVKSSVEFMTRLIAFPMQVLQQLCKPHLGGHAQVPELQGDTH